MNYYVEIEETRKAIVKVTADSFEEASRKAEDAYDNDELVFGDYLVIGTKDVTTIYTKLENECK